MTPSEKALPSPRYRLGEADVMRIMALREDAVREVGDRFYREFPDLYARFGERGRAACAEDIGYHLDFLVPVFEFGILGPFTDYLHWLESVLVSRGVPAGHLLLSLDWLAEFFIARLAPEVADPVAAALGDARQELAAAPAMGGAPNHLVAPWPEAAALQAALAAGDRVRAQTLVDEAVAAGRDLMAIEVHLLQPALYGIGREWQENRISVAQEHLATAIVQTLMAGAFGQTIPAPPNGRRALFACLAGNYHALGLRMVADGFEIAGWDVEYLGADTPFASLLERTRDFRPEIIGLSASLPQHLRPVRDAIAALRRHLGADCPRVIAGGLVINQFPALAAAVGAQLWQPDAQQAPRPTGVR